MNCDTEWREVSQAVVSHTFKAAISHAAVKTTLILFFPLYRTLVLFADEISHIASLLALLVVSAITNQCAFMLAHPARGALQMLLSLTVKNRKGQRFLFLLEKCMQLSTSTASETRDESVPLF